MPKQQRQPTTTSGHSFGSRRAFSGWLDSTLKDLRFAIRTLRRNPGFTLIIVLTLAFGIGANAAMFTVLDQVLLRLLPVKNPTQIVLLRMRGRHYGGNWGANAISYPMYRDFQDHNQVFSGMFARCQFAAAVGYGGHYRTRSGIEMVSGTYFPVLGVARRLAAHSIRRTIARPSGHPMVVLAYEYWRARFGGDPGIFGKNVAIDGHNMTVDRRRAGRVQRSRARDTRQSLYPDDDGGSRSASETTTC